MCKVPEENALWQPPETSSDQQFKEWNENWIKTTNFWTRNNSIVVNRSDLKNQQSTSIDILQLQWSETGKQIVTKKFLGSRKSGHPMIALNIQASDVEISGLWIQASLLNSPFTISRSLMGLAVNYWR